ncbi:M-phase-specific PLK1-interacting protein-like [Mercenaria mercenaria]|uniref:M-phase-specific PLK1-interacting protein-like n=1 Tax=Mercenaria mercenaria TaxID=6596 RepID=UPI00234FB50C|nr:M-phase-specific PLK1-interacting protein-like [Mercenaria mercenaria]
MDFIPFNNAASNRSKTSSPHSFKNNAQIQSPGTNMKKSLSFGSPALNMPAFGSPAVNFGAPAVQNTGLNRHHSTPSPRHYNPQYSPRARGHNQSPFQQSPRGQSPRQYSPYGNNKQSNENFRYSKDGNGFKTPHQFSPNRGRGNGRKSFNRQFGQTPRFDCNAGGSLNIEDYYHPSMIEDPWRNYKPVFLKT